MRMRSIGLGGLAAGVVILVSLSAGARPVQDTATSPAAVSAANTGSGATFDVDAVHSSMIFRVQHMGVAPFYGRFNEMSGTFTTGANPSFDISVKTASVDSNNTGRDNHLKNAEFFSAKEFPEITFKSTKATAVKDGVFEVTGDLTLRGITKPIMAELEFGGERAGRRGMIAGYHAMFSIKRTDFDMPYGVEQGALGDEVVIMIGLEGREQ